MYEGMISIHIHEDRSLRLFKYNPNSAEQLAAIEGAVKDWSFQMLQILLLPHEPALQDVSSKLRDKCK